jgi:hypothetical protein
MVKGNFRFAHIRIRVCAESIAFYRGHEKEKELTNDCFSVLLMNRFRLILWHFLLHLCSNLFTYSATIVNYSIVAASVFLFPSHLSGVIDVTSTSLTSSEISSYIALSSFNLIMLASGFSSLTNLSQPVADLAGYTARIAELLAALDQFREVRSKLSISSDSLPSVVIDEHGFSNQIPSPLDRQDSSNSLVTILSSTEMSPLISEEGAEKNDSSRGREESVRRERERLLISADPFAYADDDDVIEFSNVSCEPIFRGVR